MQTRHGIGCRLDLDPDFLRRLLQHFEHFDARAELRRAGKVAADQGQFRLAAGLQIARLDRQQFALAVFRGDDVEAALIVLGLEHAPLHLAVQRAEHLAHGDIADLEVGAPFIAAEQHRRAAALERGTVGVLALELDVEKLALGGLDRHHPAHVATARHMAAEAPLPGQAGGLWALLLPVAPGRVVQRVFLGQGRHDLAAGDAHPVAITGLGLVFEGRVLADVEIDQMIPLLRRTTLQCHSRTGVATAAHLGDQRIELLHRVQATLHGIAHAIGFARRQALGVGQVLHQRAALVIADLHAVHDLHAGDGHAPAFRRLALVADAAQTVVAFRGMATQAVLLQQGSAIGSRLGRLGLHHRGDGHRQCAGAEVVAESVAVHGQNSRRCSCWVPAASRRHGPEPDATEAAARQLVIA
ncbi:hypothetical protein D3C76_639990 [compost metagenome]